jgi:UDP-N-acetylglucosamine pyrophosphorylase
VQVKKMRAEFDSNVSFVLMNSFSTSADTKAHLMLTHPDLVKEDGWELLQNKCPKVDAATMAPATLPESPDMEWCGHPLARPDAGC